METQQNNKALVLVLKVVGIIVAVAGFIGGFVFCDLFWNHSTDPIGIGLVGIHIWIIGAIIGHFKTMTPKQRRYLWLYLILLLAGIVCLIVAPQFQSTNPQLWDRIDMAGVIFLACCIVFGYSLSKKESELPI